MRVNVQLRRWFDRHPDDHFYGDRFDTQIDEFVGGREKWSSPREDRVSTPAASISQREIKVELHEDGPIFDFLVSHAAQIPDYVSAIAALVSAWAATRKLREANLSEDDVNRKSGTRLVIGDIEVVSNSNLDPDALTELAIAVGRLQERRRPENDA